MDKLSRLNQLDVLHRERCPQYRAIAGHFFGNGPYNSPDALPYVHVSLFKDLELSSVPRDKVTRVMQSSGTSGRPSKIFLDADNSLAQMRALGEVYTLRFGKQRRQMFFVTGNNGNAHKTTATDAGYAAYHGFATLSRTSMTINEQTALSLPLIEDAPVVFGMTTYVWEHRALLSNFGHVRPIVIHGGGWKKLEATRVSRADFDAGLLERCPSAQIVNYYGCVEQLGTIYFSCTAGNFHDNQGTGTFLLRNAGNLQPVNAGVGLLQLFSAVPTSYPGHSILTDDFCELVTNCECLDPTPAFRFVARRAASPARGCANV